MLAQLLIALNLVVVRPKNKRLAIKIVKKLAIQMVKKHAIKILLKLAIKNNF